MHYYYITYMTPCGPGASFYRGEQHPLHKAAMSTFAEKVTRMLALKQGQIIPPEHVLYTAMIELPREAAKSHWPTDEHDDNIIPDAT